MNYSLADFGISAATLSNLLYLYLLFMLVSAGICLAFYFLRAIGIYEMSKTAGLKNPWYSFIPVFNIFALGRLAGTYRKKNGRSSQNSGRMLTILYIVFLFFALIYAYFAISVVVNIIFEVDAAISAGKEQSADVLKVLIPMVGSAIPFFIAGMVYLVAYYVCLWRVYAVFSQGYGTAYLILSILFKGVLESLFLFVIRKNPACSFEPGQDSGLYDITEKY